MNFSLEINKIINKNNNMQIELQKEDIEVLDKLLKQINQKKEPKKEPKSENKDRMIQLSVNGIKCDIHNSTSKNMVDVMKCLCEIVGAYNLSRKFPDRFSKDKNNFFPSGRIGAKEINVENDTYYLNVKYKTDSMEDFIKEIKMEYPYIDIQYKIILKYA